ncbi:MAG: glycosyltransferase family 39 protein [Planctomycetota bacterium]
MFGRGQITKHKLTSGALLFTASFLLYSLASPGNLPGDTELRWSVSRQILRSGSFSLEAAAQTRNCAVGVDQKRYAVSGLGQSLVLLPFAGLGLILEKVTPFSSDVSDLLAQFLASVILFPAVGAAAVWVFFRLILSLGYSEKASLIAAAVLGFATMHFHYSVNTQEQTQITLLLVLAILFMVKYYRQRRVVYMWLFCVVLGICFLFRPSSASVVLPIYLVAVGGEIFASEKTSRARGVGKWLAAGVCGIGSFLVFLGWYNYVRFGSVFESGYGLSTATSLGSHGLFESSPLPTLAAMLFSPGKSIFLYNPVLLLFPLCVYDFYRRHKVAALAVTAAIVSNFVFHSFYTAWAGDYAWSIRYQVPVLPFLILPMVVFFKTQDSRPKTQDTKPEFGVWKILVISLVSISCVLQLASVVYNFNLEFVQNPNHHVIAGDYVWDWSQSHLRKRFENIIGHIAGKRDFSSVKVTDAEPMLLKFNHSEQSVRDAYGVNFFPFKANRMLAPEKKKLFYPLLCLWLALLAGFCVAVSRVRHIDNSVVIS